MKRLEINPRRITHIKIMILFFYINYIKPVIEIVKWRFKSFKKTLSRIFEISKYAQKIYKPHLFIYIEHKYFPDFSLISRLSLQRVNFLKTF